MKWRFGADNPQKIGSDTILTPGATLNGSLWSINVKIKNQQSRAAPALGAYQGRLQLVHLGNNTNQLWHSIFDGSWRPNVQIENQSSSTGAGIAGYQNQLVMVHVGSSSTSL